MFVVIAAAGVVAVLPGMETASHMDPTNSRKMDAAATHSFPVESVRAIAISFDCGKVTLGATGAGSSSTDVAISVTHSVASTAESSLSALATSVRLDDSTGVLAITGVWNGGVEDVFAAPAAELQLEIPRSLSIDTLSVEVRIGTVGTRFEAQSSGDQALSMPWQGFAAPTGDIVWKGDASMKLGRVSLATVEGSITATDLEAVEISVASDHGASISLKRVSAHILTIASGAAAIDAEVSVTPQESWPVAVSAVEIQWVAPHSKRAGGWLALSTVSASSVRLSLESSTGGRSAASATAVEVDCGSRSGATCILEVPGGDMTRLCGSVVARSETFDGGPTASTLALFADVTGSNDVAVATVQDTPTGGLSDQRTATLECSGAQTERWIRGSVVSRAAAVLLRAT
eukprot:COSAG02_NODE_445_length_22163_cov_55.680611_10_plen_403_part_00